MRWTWAIVAVAMLCAGARVAAQNPPEKRFFGSKALINACKDYRNIRNFPKRTLLRRSVYEKVAGRWNSLGLSGTAPAIPSFDNASDAHE